MSFFLIKNNIINSSHMKILHLGKKYYPDKGGIESVTKYLAEGMVKRGYCCTVICFTSTSPTRLEMLSGVSVYKIHTRLILKSQPLSLKYFYHSALQCLKSDIVHLHAPNILGMITAIIFSRKKLVLHWHSDIINKGIFGVLVKPIEYYCAKIATKIIATSSNYVEHSNVLKRFKKKVSIVPLGVDLDQFSSNFNLRRRKTVLAVGRLVKYKGFEFLIKAFKNVEEDADLIIVGNGPEEERLKTLSCKLQINNRVFFRGNINDKELKLLFKTSHLFCLPSISKSEAFGVVLLEAMASGLPIISSDIIGSGISWVNENMVSGIKVRPKNINDLSKAIDLLLKDKKLRLKLARGAKSRVRKLFDNKNNIKKTLKIYSNMSF